MIFGIVNDCLCWRVGVGSSTYVVSGCRLRVRNATLSGSVVSWSLNFSDKLELTRGIYLDAFDLCALFVGDNSLSGEWGSSIMS